MVASLQQPHPPAVLSLLPTRLPHTVCVRHPPQVYAIDLIGFGASDKPVQQYTIELWAELINDFLAEFGAGTPAVVVGNSIGSLSVLTAAAAAPEGLVEGVVLLNSAGAMNNKVGSAG